MNARPVGITWQPSSLHGWGVFGINLAHQMAIGGRRLPVFIGTVKSALIDLEGEQKQVLDLVLQFSADFHRQMAPKGPDATVNFPVLVGLGEDLMFEPYRRSAEAEHGILFLTDTAISSEAIERARRFKTIVAGAAWTESLLRAHGIDHVKVVIQGIDHTIFNVRPRQRGANGKFMVFSGGKLEYRKGQDIVIAAWREFYRRHPDSQLIIAWNHPYAEIAETIGISGLVTPAPPPWGADQTPMTKWLAENGLPPGSFQNLGAVPNRLMPAVLCDVDAAVFTSRAEGGTNLVAMEAMACGVPTVLSANTGHLDLIEGDNCYPLRTQGRVAPGHAKYVGTDGWGESSVDELIESLEAIYSDRAEAQRRGAAGAATLSRISWARQVPKLLDAIGV